MIEFQCLAYGIDPNRDGISILISVGTHHVLFDCGLRDIFPLLLDLNRISRQNEPALPLDAIFCSHAHADHSQNLFQLHGTYPDIPIYMSRATAKLLEFHHPHHVLSDSFRQALTLLEWRSPISINPELSLELLPVGHLPGAAAGLLTYQPQDSTAPANTLLYTGDICLSNSRLTDGLPLQSYRSLSPDILIVEGTLGTEKLPNRRQQENQFIQDIQTTLDEQRQVVIQVSPLGMAQELILLFKSHPCFANQPIQIWIDSDIQQACDLMLSLITELPNRVQNFAKTQSLFLEDKLSPQVKSIQSSDLPTASDRSTIILLSDSDDICTYAQRCEVPWTLFLPTDPDQVPDATHQESDQQIKQYRLENHPDGQGILQLIHNLKPQHVAFSHGSAHALADLCCLEELISRYHLHLPQKGKPLDILVGLNPLLSEATSLTEMMFEGELQENNQGISISLPPDVTQDNRWEAIADSGIILATWQGENLVIKGISQRELISNQQHQIKSNQPTCIQCAFYRAGQCLCAESPLHRRTVTPDGYCPAYQAKSS